MQTRKNPFDHWILFCAGLPNGLEESGCGKNFEVDVANNGSSGFCLVNFARSLCLNLENLFVSNVSNV